MWKDMGGNQMGEFCVSVQGVHRGDSSPHLLWFKAGAPRAEHYLLVLTLSTDAVVTVL